VLALQSDGPEAIGDVNVATDVCLRLVMAAVLGPEEMISARLQDIIASLCEAKAKRAAFLVF
jgi:hypothetical protein